VLPFRYSWKDRRKTARLFASSPGVQCRDRLRAGGSRIRTLGPAADTDLSDTGPGLNW
jgi:hypothetical protein